MSNGTEKLYKFTKLQKESVVLAFQETLRAVSVHYKRINLNISNRVMVIGASDGLQRGFFSKTTVSDSVKDFSGYINLDQNDFPIRDLYLDSEKNIIEVKPKNQIFLYPDSNANMSWNHVLKNTQRINKMLYNSYKFSELLDIANKGIDFDKNSKLLVINFAKKGSFSFINRDKEEIKKYTCPVSQHVVVDLEVFMDCLLKLMPFDNYVSLGFVSQRDHIHIIPTSFVDGDNMLLYTLSPIF